MPASALDSVPSTAENQGVGGAPAVPALRKKKQKNQTFTVSLSYTSGSRPPWAIRDPLTQTSKMRWSQGAESQFGKQNQSNGELLGRGENAATC